MKQFLKDNGIPLAITIACLGLFTYVISDKHSESNLPVPNFHISRVAAENHTWVLFEKYKEGESFYVLHHPDCPCGWMKKGEVKK